MADPSKLGAKLGPRLALLMADAAIRARVDSAPHVQRAALSIVNDYIDSIGEEMRSRAGAFAQQIADAPELPDWARNLFTFVAQGKGEASMLLSFAYYGSGLGNVIVQLLTNELNPALTKLIADNPNAYHTPAEAARMSATGVWDYTDAKFEAARGGIAGTRFDHLLELAFQWPGLSELFASVNRGTATEDAARHALQRQGVHPDWIDTVLQLRHVLLSPAELADMTVRGIIDTPSAEAEAARSGVDADRFAKLALQAGFPPAIQELLLLYRRGQIDDARLEHGIRQSRVRNEWIDAVKMLRYVPPPASEAIRGRVENHLDDATARKLFAEAGIDPVHYEWMYETAGRPPGVELLLRLLNRGLVDQSFVEQAIRESDIKNKYIDAIVKSKVYLPPVRSIAHLFTTGAVTYQRAFELYMDDGVTPEDARAYLSAASATKVQAHKELAVSTITQLYRDGVIDRPTTTTMIEAHGYDATEAAYIIELADLQREQHALDTAVSKIHSLFVGHKIAAGDASNALARLGVAGTQSTQLLQIWQLEADANVRLLTPAQIVKAAQSQIIGVDEAQVELENLGYVQRDAQIVLALAGMGPLAPGPAR